MIYNSNNIKKLFSELGINYINDYIFEFKDIETLDCYATQYYLDNKPEFEDLTKTYGTKIKNKDTANLYVKKTPNKGYGLFTAEELQEGDFIGVYIGVIREENEFVPFDESGYDTDYAWDFPDDSHDFPALEINAKYKGNELRFANHDKEPNLLVEHTVVENKWYIFFLAGRTIAKDEELSISYGEAYWDTDYRELS